MNQKKTRLKLSLKEFKEYCAGKEFYRYVFEIRNQKWFAPSCTIRTTATYYHMRISFNPNRICIYNDNSEKNTKYRQNWLEFDSIQHIFIEKTVLGDLFTVVCESRDETGDDTYTIIAQEKIDVR